MIPVVNRIRQSHERSRANRAVAMLFAVAWGGCGTPYRQTTESYDPSLGDFGAVDVYQPEGPELRPGVVLIHGGGWTSGSKGDLAGDAAQLAAAGYFVANVNYRLSPAAQFPLPIQDVCCALAFVRTHASELGVDPSRVALLGYSAGGYLAEMVGLGATDQRLDCPSGTTGLPAAVLAGDAPADLLHLPSLGDGMVEAFVGMPQSTDPALYTADSPISHVGPQVPPFLLIHGTGDLFVSWTQSATLQRELVADGNSASLLLLSGAGHVLNAGPDFGGLNYVEDAIDTPEGWSAILQFLQQTLGAPPP